MPPRRLERLARLVDEILDDQLIARGALDAANASSSRTNGDTSSSRSAA
jgi:hypothetical protein